jgi:simple sugar transport system permease protein
VAYLNYLGIGLAFGIVQGYLVSYLEIQPFIVTLAGMFFAKGMVTVVSAEPQTAENAAFLALKDARVEIPWLGFWPRTAR